MTDHKIKKLAIEYRKAIEDAQSDGKFDADETFSKFPEDCCGDTCVLLAEFLRESGVETIWCSTTRGHHTHSWLVVKDERVNIPEFSEFSYPSKVKKAIAQYGAKRFRKEGDIISYTLEDLMDGLIIDITADQYVDCDKAVYVGLLDDFHYSFEFIMAQDHNGLNNRRICNLYQTIEEYL